MRRWALLLVAIVALPAQAKRASYGDYVKAARAIEEWRFDDARTLVAALDKAAPRDPETRYLVAEMAFLDGDYPRASEILAELAKSSDEDAREYVASLRPLVDATREATSGFASQDSAGGHFTFHYKPGKDEALVELAGEALEAAYQRIGDDLGYQPPGKVRVEILPRASDLARVSTLSESDIETSGTIALCKYNKLMIVSPRATLFGYPWMDTLVHEYTHYVVSRATNDGVPIWLHEGLAKFEESRWRVAGGEQELGRLYEGLLHAALARGRLISFEEMHPSMAKLPSQEAASTAFAEVYTMVAWLHAELGYAGLRDVLGKIKDGTSERRAIAEALGEKSFDAVESRWKKRLRKLDLRPFEHVRGVRLKRGAADKPGKDGDENLGLDEIAGDKARKLARLGGLLRARGRLKAAAAEYEKARTAAPGQALILSKLARTYLELGDAKKAIDVAEPLVALDPEEAAPRATLGAAYLEAGDMAKAGEHLSAALRVSPFDPAVRCGLQRVFAATGDPTREARERKACDALRD